MKLSCVKHENYLTKNSMEGSAFKSNIASGFILESYIHPEIKIIKSLYIYKTLYETYGV